MLKRKKPRRLIRQADGSAGKEGDKSTRAKAGAAHFIKLCYRHRSEKTDARGTRLASEKVFVRDQHFNVFGVMPNGSVPLVLIKARVYYQMLTIGYAAAGLKLPDAIGLKAEAVLQMKDTLDGIDTETRSMFELVSGIGVTDEEENGTMAKKKAKKKVSKKAAVSGGSRMTLFGFSITAVLRACGKAGIKAKEAVAAMEAMKIPVALPTVYAQIGAGKGGVRGEPAPLTAAQLKEIKSVAVVKDGKKKKAAPAKKKAVKKVARKKKK